MGFDITKWGVNELLEDFLEKPIKVTIENVSDKYILKGTLQVFKKGDKHEILSKTVQLDKKPKHSRVAKGFAK